MKKTCPKCKGKKTEHLLLRENTCKTCNGIGEVALMKESVANRLGVGSLHGLQTDGYQETGQIDTSHRLLTIIVPDKEFDDAKHK